MQIESITNYETVSEFLSGGGEMGQRIREFDWTTTPLGEPATWPQSLKTCIRIMLTSRQPIWIGWGKELIKFYNDPYKDIVRGKHPWALGVPASVVWKEIWNDIEPMLQQVMEKNEGTYVESQLLIMERNGYPEETYYTFSYTPIPGDQGGTAGMFCANTDDTEKIISGRQLETLTVLGKTLIDSKSFREVIENTINTLSENPYDFPFSLFRKVENNKANLIYSSPLGESVNLIPQEIDLSTDVEVATTINKAITTRKLQVIEGLREKLGKLPTGGWEKSPDKVIVIPIMQPAVKDPYGILVVGLNPFRLLDEKYRSFFSLVADQMATSFTQVHVLEEERKRAAALAEIDKAKTIFFTNISHEFRTPLTLMLGSLEELLNKTGKDNDSNRNTIETTHRNAMRLLRLVNNLLDFSRIEAGRIKAQFQLTDICRFTTDLASNFRAVAEAAGLEFQIRTDAIIQPVYIDKEMWEKIVLNLLSNAFKYTLKGSIMLSLQVENKQVVLRIRDTGVGIPEKELPKMFERFHRVENITGRSFEGTGIGLSLVKELVQLHGGEISVSSKIEEGSEFVVTIPTGKAHLPTEQLVEREFDFDASLSDAFIEEANTLIDQSFEEEEKIVTANQATVLVVDDNVDMRRYLKSLLEKKFNVVTANNGMEALHKVGATMPELVVSDIMMPIMDGIQLLKALKENPVTSTIPVILVSARAGEESKIEGYEIGADDYLTKPFSSRELMARVSAQISLSKKRKAAERHLQNLFMQTPAAIQILRGPEFVYELANERSLQLLQRSREQVIGHKVIEVMPEAEEQGILDMLRKVYLTGEKVLAEEVPIYFSANGQKTDMYVKVLYQPLRDEEGRIDGIMIAGDDITAQVIARKKIEESEAQFRTLNENLEKLVEERTEELRVKNRQLENSQSFLQQLINSSVEFISVLDPGLNYLTVNNKFEETLNLQRTEVEGRNILEINPKLTGSIEVESIKRALKGETVYLDKRPSVARPDIYVDTYFIPLLIQGNIEGVLIMSRDVTDIVKTEKLLEQKNQELVRSNEDLQQFAHVASHDLKEPVRKVRTFANRLRTEFDGVLTGNAKSYLSKMEKAAARMSTMIDGVLQYSSLTAVEDDPRPVDLNEVIKDIQSDLEITIGENGAIIESSNLPTVSGYSILLYQLFYNLINNSLKFVASGKAPVVRIKSETITETNHNNREEYFRISIQDNGIGFSETDARKIFKPFSRLNSKDKYEGTGLGLALCKKIVERHGGLIEATGVEGSGSTFYISLPKDR